MASSSSSVPKIQKFGVQTDKGKVIYCFRNADKHQAAGVRVLVHPTKFKTMDQLKTELSKKVGLPTGPVMKIYTADKRQVKNLDDFEDNHKYICCGAEKLSEDVPVGIIREDVATGESPAPPTFTTTSTEETTTTPSEPSAASSSSSTTPKERKPVVRSYEKGTPEKFGVQTDKGKIINCYRNGDKHHSGVRIIVHPTKFKSFDQLREHMTKLVGLPTGAVRKVYTPEGRPIKTLEEIEDGKKYVCCGAEPFNRELLPTAAKDEPSA
eukprot:TRINITY_DN1248_c0_g3_i2.p1 TRINITY_DN1248_c0_g3~~TRINITY_DN1248_c0_g3_i2.p1  ORF type:complete len:267 (+),score=56.08 TRINITY_DN1248_c0_g3_i2:248-1048(+)